MTGRNPSQGQDPLQIIIPVYNEGKNFAALRAALRTIAPPYKAFVIYDFDADDTVPMVQRAIDEGEDRFRLVKNSVGPGVVGALQTGFKLASQGPVLVMMGDLSDDLANVDAMVSLHARGYHLVAASRYMRGGQAVGGPLLKRNLSKWAGLTLYWLRGIPIHDPTNSFKLYDAAMLKALKLESRGGFELSLEITVKAFLAGYQLAELPTTWRDRTHGQSRFRLWRWLPLYSRWYLHAFRPRTVRHWDEAAL